MQNLNHVQVQAAVEEAYKTARLTADTIMSNIEPIQGQLERGYVGLNIDLDARSSLGRCLLGIGSTMMGTTIRPRYYDEGGGMTVYFHTSGMEKLPVASVQEMAMLMALNVLHAKLGIQGCVEKLES